MDFYTITAAIGRFFAAKFRSAVLWRVFERNGDRNAAIAALTAYRLARDAFAEAAEAGKVYVDDVSYGPEPWLRGHWRDRLPAIDADIEDVRAQAEKASATPAGQPAGRRAILVSDVLNPPARWQPGCDHTPPRQFEPGRPLELELDNRRALWPGLAADLANQPYFVARRSA